MVLSIRYLVKFVDFRAKTCVLIRSKLIYPHQANIVQLDMPENRVTFSIILLFCPV